MSRYGVQVSGFGYVLTYQSVRLLICSPLPGSIRISKVAVYLQALCNRTVFGKFFSVIAGQRMAHLLPWLEHSDDQLPNRWRATSLNLSDQGIAADPIN